jgi:lycopene beta-cyclase
MLRSNKFADKRILVLEKEPKTINDRTWCFWEKEKGFFEEIVYSEWDTISFFSDSFSSSMLITPYKYKMIRGIDLYQYCFKEIEKNSQVEVVYGEISNWKIKNDELLINISGKEHNFANATVFNSLYRAGPDKATITLLQHFKGWIIETAEPVFEPGKATIMDFRVHQQHGTSFAYMLPLTVTSALVEYTLFSKELLQPAEYEKELKDYIETFLEIKEYKKTDEEFGVIPMTNESFRFFKDGAYHIGTAGGQTKASSGYTFQFIQKRAQQIVDHLIAGAPLENIPGTPKRFRFYDNTLLDILYHNKLPGKDIFTTLFQKNKPQQVLRFLDNESSMSEELKIISSLPVWPFLKAAFKQLG